MPSLFSLRKQQKLLKAEIKHREEALRLAKESLKSVRAAIKEKEAKEAERRASAV